MKTKAVGFTLIEILVALAIMAALTAILYPAVSGKVRDARTSAIAQSLQGYAQAISEFKKATTRYPGSLNLLTIAPVGSTDKDICGNVLSTTPASLWRGPYMTRVMPPGGMPMGDAVILPALRRATSGTEIYLMVDLTGVESSTTGDLEAQFDAGTQNFLTGTIRATTGAVSGSSPAIGAAVPSTYNVSYAIPINSC